MKRFAILLLCLLAVGAGAKSPLKLKLMTYNLHHCEGLDKKLDIPRIASLIKSQKVDAVAVQELDSMAKRSGRVYQMEQLGQLAGLHHTYARSIPLQGGAYGIGMLSKNKPLSVRRIPLPGREESRMLLVCEFEDYVYACTHLSLKNDSRLASLPIILAEAQRWGKPFFIAGDWNSKPDSPFMQQLQQSFQLLNDISTYTFPAPSPVETIDYIAVYRGPQASVKKSAVIPETVASDHRPVRVNVTIKK